MPSPREKKLGSANNVPGGPNPTREIPRRQFSLRQFFGSL